MEQSVLTNALRILLFCIVLWSLVFWLMGRLRVPDRYLDGLPLVGRNVIVVGLIACVVSIQFLFNSHWRAAFDQRWWTYRMDWYIMFFTTLKLVDSMRIHTKSSKAAAAKEAAQREERRMQRKKSAPTPKRPRNDQSSPRARG